jgi:predicted Zn-dependent protease
VTHGNRSWQSSFFLLASLLWISACASAPYTGRKQLILIDSSKEMALGQRAAADVMKKSQVSREVEANQRVRQVGTRIAAAADRRDFQWEFHVIENAKEVNAFCLPGGKIFVYTGMFQYAATDAELATVMAHEVAHALARHGAERMSTAMLAELGGAVAGAALNIQTPVALDLFNIAYGMAAEVGVILPHSRGQELEADRIGLILMAKAGYDPRAAIGFWEKMSHADKGSALPAFLSTHPADAARIAQIKSLIPEALGYYKEPAR